MELLDKLENILTAFEQEAGKKLALFALLKMDDLTDRWTIILMANWITDSNRRDVFNQFVVKVNESLNANEQAAIARIGLLDSTDHLSIELLKRRTGAELWDEKVNGNLIHEGYIIRAEPDLLDSTQSKLIFNK